MFWKISNNFRNWLFILQWVKMPYLSALERKRCLNSPKNILFGKQFVHVVGKANLSSAQVQPTRKFTRNSAWKNAYCLLPRVMMMKLCFGPIWHHATMLKSWWSGMKPIKPILFQKPPILPIVLNYAQLKDIGLWRSGSFTKRLRKLKTPNIFANSGPELPAITEKSVQTLMTGVKRKVRAFYTNAE